MCIYIYVYIYVYLSFFSYISACIYTRWLSIRVSPFKAIPKKATTDKKLRRADDWMPPKVKILPKPKVPKAIFAKTKTILPKPPKAVLAKAEQISLAKESMSEPKAIPKARPLAKAKSVAKESMPEPKAMPKARPLANAKPRGKLMPTSKAKSPTKTTVKEEQPPEAALTNVIEERPEDSPEHKDSQEDEKREGEEDEPPKGEDEDLPQDIEPEDELPEGDDEEEPEDELPQGDEEEDLPQHIEPEDEFPWCWADAWNEEEPAEDTNTAAGEEEYQRLLKKAKIMTFWGR